MQTRPRHPRTLHPVVAWSKLNPDTDFEAWKGRCKDGGDDYRRTKPWCEAEEYVEARLGKYKAELKVWQTKFPEHERLYQDMLTIRQLRIEDEEIEDEIREAQAEMEKQQKLMERKGEQRARIANRLHDTKRHCNGDVSLDVRDEDESSSGSDEE